MIACTNIFINGLILCADNFNRMTSHFFFYCSHLTQIRIIIKYLSCSRQTKLKRSFLHGVEGTTIDDEDTKILVQAILKILYTKKKAAASQGKNDKYDNQGSIVIQVSKKVIMMVPFDGYKFTKVLFLLKS